MTQDELTIDVKDESDDTIVFTLHGALDIATAPQARAALLDASDHKREIVVDLSSLGFLDSTGLGALIGTHRRALEHGGRVRLVVREGPIARLLNITGLVRVFEVYTAAA